VYWPEGNVDATFLACDILPAASEGKLYAVLAHCFFGDNIVLADIPGRGPTVPSGRIEPGESVADALEREVREETGARLHPSRRRLVGVTVLRSRETPELVSYSPVFIAEVTTFDPIPEGSESAGFLLVAPEALADTYYSWDPLLEAEFEYVLERRAALFLPGISLSEFAGESEAPTGP
jgi:ADP-ribose pyrophosphatase YjhB (NUDIX family)